jgi:hypothetical protein
MSAPTVTDLPPLPTFPAGPGLPDQPGVFIPQFLAFLDALQNWPSELSALVTYLEGLSGGSSSSSGAVLPMVDGSVPAVFLQQDDGSLVYTGI